MKSNDLFSHEDLVGQIKAQVLKEAKISDLSDNKLKLFIIKVSQNFLQTKKIQLEINQVYELAKQVFFRIRGLGILENIICDDEVSEIMVNGLEHIFIEKKGNMIKFQHRIESEKEYYRIIQKIVGKAGREINISNPIVDARLEDGSRVNIVLPPIAYKQPVMTIRKFPKKHIDMEFLIKNKTISQEVAEFLELLVKAKFNILIGGGTSSGKTTFLNALTEFIDKNERIITIEDSRELIIDNKENLISLETRNSNSANKGKIDISSLIKNSLRMRPDRIIVGEVRSKETIDMLTALNTGHDGGLTTAHANSPIDMISRLETMVLRAGENIPIEAVKRMIGSSIDIIIHIAKIDQNKRRVIDISEVTYLENKIELNRLFEFDYASDKLIKTKNALIKTQKISKEGFVE